MSLLISGSAGFIGSHLVQHILENTNWDIILLDRLDSTVNLDRLTSIPNWSSYKNRTRFVWWDLKAEFNDSMHIKLLNVDTVIHAASSSHVDRSIEDPLLFTMDNVFIIYSSISWL